MTCSVSDCTRKAVARGWCHMHYKRARYGRYGLAGQPLRRKTCEHCDRPAVARGWCPRHWKQWRLHGDPLYADRRRAVATSTRTDKRGYVFARGAENRPVHRELLDARPGEVVHHINGFKHDNAVENLVRLANQSEHKQVHASLEAAAFGLVRAGVITFDHATKRYRLAEGG